MTNCASVRDDLKAFCDNELPLWRRLAVRRHLARCASCREEVSQMQQITEELRTEEKAVVLDSALREKILASAPVPPELEAKRRSWRPAIAWGIAAIALIALFILHPLLTSMQTLSSYQASSPSAIVGIAGEQQVAGKAVPRPTAPAPRDSGADPALEEPPVRQVHKEATISVDVTDPEARSDDVAQMVKESGGFVASNTLSTGDDGLKSVQLTIKVPVIQFEVILGQIVKLGNVKSKNITGEDITEKTSDAAQAEGVLEDEVQKSETRLKAMGSKAKWRDEQAARDMRIEMAQARARLQLLKKMASLSTISVSLTEKPKPVVPLQSGFLSNMSGTTHAAFQSLLTSTGTSLTLVIWILAYAPLWLLIVLLGRYISRHPWAKGRT